MAAIPKKVLYKKNSQFLQISGLKDTTVTPNVYLNTATVVATLYNSSGAAIAGFTNVNGQYVASSNGTYQFALDPTLFDPPVGSGYTIKVTATQGVKQFYVELPAQVLARQQGTET